MQLSSSGHGKSEKALLTPLWAIMWPEVASQMHNGFLRCPFRHCLANKRRLGRPGRPLRSTLQRPNASLGLAWRHRNRCWPLPTAFLTPFLTMGLRLSSSKSRKMSLLWSLSPGRFFFVFALFTGSASASAGRGGHCRRASRQSRHHTHSLLWATASRGANGTDGSGRQKTPPAPGALSHWKPQPTGSCTHAT